MTSGDNLDQQQMNKIQADKIIKSKRKTTTIAIDSQGQLIIRAPNKTTNKIIEEILHKKRNWIVKKQTERVEQNKRMEQITTEKGLYEETLLYLEEFYKLCTTKNIDKPLFFDGKQFFLKCNKNIHRIFTKWYQHQAKELYSSLTNEYAKKYNLKYKSISISNGRKTLGSCNKHGDLKFSWRTLKLPFHIAEYLVAHELAHLKHLNHSKEFWNTVEHMLPKYKKSKRWMKENSHFMMML